MRGRSGVLDRDDDVRDAYAAHGPELYRFAFRALGDGGAAQDAVQEAFLRAWRASGRFDPRQSSLRGWLFAILRNVVLDSFRTQRSRPRLRLGLEHHTETVGRRGSDTHDPGEHLLRSWLVEEALRRIGADHREAIVQTYLLDRAYDEVAAELGIPTSTLRSRVFYGLKALRVVLEEMEVEL